jgi:hypothetical protein
MGRLAQLQSYSLEELVGEIERRRAEMSSALARIGAGAGSGPGSGAKNPRMSDAKRQHWAGWHTYKAQHPDATVTEWRRLRKRGKA